VKVDFNGFNTYDVEPVSIPDVLAGRPVLVFGKWRGNPGGLIKLSGMTGEGKYSQTVKVADYKPSRDNAALKYLWARQRITILSDYNKLRSDDKRIKEVTDLGLNYNLLTAYTSFVAVDNEVRNVDGKPTSVKQPLPLPEGVSDYAVGGQMNCAMAPAPAMYKGMRTDGKMESRFSRDKSAREEIQTPGKKDKEQKVSIVSVTAGRGPAKDEMLKVVRDGLSDLEKCLSGKKVSGTIKINLTINADGTIRNVEIAEGVSDGQFRQCVVRWMRLLIFPAPANGQTVRATVLLRI
jgi:Ca-activated chloride channel family protein